jgi:serine/threonine protein kinase
MNREVGGFELRERIGTGGMASVYRAIQKSLGRPVVLKILYPHLAEDAQFVQRFEREARAAALMRHENIVQVIDFGRTEDAFFIAMEYVEGMDLRKWMQVHGTPPMEMSLLILRDLCRGLEHAHGHHIVHRDVKPANVMFTPDGAVKIMDFGLARSESEGATHVTMVGTVLGTAHYMSPEQAAGGTVDERSDVFSTGVLAYELLGGRLPFPGDSYSAVIGAVLTVEPPSLGEINPLVTPELVSIVGRMLQKDVERRYGTIREVREALDDMAEQMGLHRGRDLLREYAQQPERVKQILEQKRLRRHLDQGRYFETLGRGRIDDALLEFRRVLHLDPRHDEARQHVQRLEHDRGRMDPEPQSPAPEPAAGTVRPDAPDAPPPDVGQGVARGADGPAVTPAPAAAAPPGAPAQASEATLVLPAGRTTAEPSEPAAVAPAMPGSGASAPQRTPAAPGSRRTDAPQAPSDVALERVPPPPRPAGTPHGDAARGGGRVPEGRSGGGPGRPRALWFGLAAALVALVVVVIALATAMRHAPGGARAPGSPQGTDGSRSASGVPAAPQPRGEPPAAGPVAQAPVESLGVAPDTVATPPPPAAPTPPVRSPSEVLAGARKLVAARQYSPAVLELRALLRNHPPAALRLDAQVLLACALAERGSRTDARQLLQALARNPDFHPADVGSSPVAQEILYEILHPAPAPAAPAAGRTPAAPPPAPATGSATVSVKVLPWGDLEVDGRRRDRNKPAYSITLPAGDHVIRVVNTRLHLDKQWQIRVVPGEPQQLEYDFNQLTGTLVVSVTDGWAEVFVDGDRKGNTPATFTVSPGRHHVWVKPGADMKVDGGPREVEVKPSSSQNLVFTLKRRK